MNYGDIKTHFKNLLNRSDVTDALVVTFIDQGISRIQRQLRTAANEKKKTYEITAQSSSITLPNDFIEIISLYHSTNELRRITMERYRELTGNVITGTPEFFVREQNVLKLYPEPASGDVVLYYYGEFDEMTADSDENALAVVAPDLITYAALTYASDYYYDDRSEIFENKYIQFLTELQEQANDQEINGGTQAVMPSQRYDEE